jgi:uncharacterized delta-60 repeat protein
MYNASCSGLLVRKCMVTDNYCSGDGAGIYNTDCTSLAVEGCTFSGNVAAGASGALDLTASSGTVANCVFTDNSAGAGGGGVSATGSSSVILANCSFCGNTGSASGSAIFTDSSPDVANCIIWGNESPAFGGGGSPTVTYSDIQDGPLDAGCIQVDPLFADAAVGDLRPRFDSPCIDAADGGSAPPTDIFGNARYDYPLTANTGTGTPDYADMGAYEHAYAPGDLAWARQAGSAEGPDIGHGVAALPGGRAVVAGEFQGTATFGPGEPGETTVTAATYDDTFVARCGPDGSLAWAMRHGSGGNEGGESVCDVVVLADGSAVVTGEFNEAVTYGSGEPNETTLDSEGDDDIYIVRYALDGSLIWAKAAGGYGDDIGHAIAALPDGSTLVAGEFEGTATFGLDELNETTLTSGGADDIFIARYGPDGSLVWAKAAGGAGDDRPHGVAAFADGSAVITGEFEGTAIFGALATGEETLVSAGYEDIFVARYRPDGTLAWAKSVGDTGSDRGYGVAALSDGSSVVTGEFEDTVTFGPGEDNVTTFASAGSDDVFVARYYADGTLAWAKRVGAGSSDRGYGISALDDDSMVVTGEFESTVTFGVTDLVSDGDDDIFVAHYEPDGTLTWAKRAGGVGNDKGFGVATLPDGSVVVTGEFEDAAAFGPDDPPPTVLTSAGEDDVFIAMYQPNGNLIWAKRAGGIADDIGRAVDFCWDGSVIVAGKFERLATFGPGEANETSFTAEGYAEIFVAQFKQDGDLSVLKRAVGTGHDEAKGIASLPDGSALVTGHNHSSELTFGPGESGETMLTTYGSADPFLARHAPDGSLVWVKPEGGANYDEGNCIAVRSDGSSAVVGRFYDSSVFGFGEAKQTSLTSAGDDDIFVASFNPDGTLAWAARAGGTGDDKGHGITVLPDDSVVITGEFEDTATFGEGVGQVTLDSAGYDDVFIARYLSDGTLDWAKRAGGAWGEMGNAVAALSDGSVVVVGYIDGLATFGPDEPGMTLLDNAGSDDIFVARYNPNGSLAWAKRAGGSAGNDRAYGVCALPDDTTVVTGFFYGAATWGEGEANETSLLSAGGDDIFVARYDPAGALIWARRAGGLDEDRGNGAAALADGSVVVTGYFGARALFGEGTWSEAALTSSGNADVFVARYYP